MGPAKQARSILQTLRPRCRIMRKASDHEMEFPPAGIKPAALPQVPAAKIRLKA